MRKALVILLLLPSLAQPQFFRRLVAEKNFGQSILSPVSENRTQTGIFAVGISIGAIEINSYNHPDKRIFSLYPEIEVSGRFIVRNFQWGLFWGYWRQSSPDYPNGIADGLNYRSSGHIAGFRLYYNLLADTIKPFNVTLAGGITDHLVFFNNTSGGISGDMNDQDHRKNYFYLEYGLNLIYRLSSGIHFQASISNSTISNRDAHSNNNRLLLKSGFIYSFNI